MTTPASSSRPGPPPTLSLTPSAATSHDHQHQYGSPSPTRPNFGIDGAQLVASPISPTPMSTGAGPTAPIMARSVSASSSAFSDAGHAVFTSGSPAPGSTLSTRPQTGGPSASRPYPPSQPIGPPPERFIIVRPPAGKQNHPLNLQIQLVLAPAPQRAGNLRQPASREASFGSVAASTMSTAPTSASQGPTSSNDLALRRRSTDGTDISGPSQGSMHAVAHATPSHAFPPTSTTSSRPSDDDHGPTPLTPSTPATLTSEPWKGAPLRRTPSNRSNKSARSVATTMSGWSGTSDASVATTGSVGGMERKVTPLYNLQWHTVLPTWISDAGTDAKIARFAKKGIEINDFGHIEPSEIRSVVHGVEAYSALSRDSVRSARSATGIVPSLSANSIATGSTQASKSGPTTPTTATGGEEKGAAAFLNKLKRFSINPKAKNPASFFSGGASPTTPTAGEASAGSAGPSSPLHALGFNAGPAPPTAEAPADLPPTNAALSSVGPAAGSGRRAEGYMWAVKKWTRPDLDQLMQLLGTNGFGAVTVEWKKGKKRRTAGQGKLGLAPVRSATVAETIKKKPSEDALRPMGPTTRASFDVARTRPEGIIVTGEEDAHDPNQLVTDRQRSSRQNRQSFHSDMVGAARPVSPSKIGSRQSPERQDSNGPSSSRGGSDVEADEGEDSDPEDSERPWTCELVIPAASTGHLGLPATRQRRIHIGTIKPHPHHPRLIASLAVPGNLAPVALGSPATGVTADLRIEEIKDLVAITCLWLCVKEGIGGLGSSGRKRRGDGAWRIGKK